MEPEGPLPCLQQPATGPYPELEECSVQLANLFKNHFVFIALPARPKPFKWTFI
jgi:hypothetical protein